MSNYLYASACAVEMEELYGDLGRKKFITCHVLKDERTLKRGNTVNMLMSGVILALPTLVSTSAGFSFLFMFMGKESHPIMRLQQMPFNPSTDDYKATVLMLSVTSRSVALDAVTHFVSLVAADVPPQMTIRLQVSAGVPPLTTISLQAYTMQHWLCFIAMTFCIGLDVGGLRKFCLWTIKSLSMLFVTRISRSVALEGAITHFVSLVWFGCGEA
ncbi:hypothetical protein Ddye_003431 [Dipteronia dyeriana]|uniref:Uncharacterized protein n=1 Tax=Dipteronia dyeriana TaxID=168575 RepID=A0AAE0CVA5_9ROSI|nr:hypothetical protein Ddye_003431 [Dipteronia dyeriana]